MAKPEQTYCYPPRGMRVEQAAAYLGFRRTFFLEMVEQGKMPKPIRFRGIVLWDRMELEAAFDDLKSAPQNAVHLALSRMAELPSLSRKRGREKEP